MALLDMSITFDLLGNTGNLHRHCVIGDRQRGDDLLQTVLVFTDQGTLGTALAGSILISVLTASSASTCCTPPFFGTLTVAN